MKKTLYIWIIICLFSISILLELGTDYGVLFVGHTYYSSASLSLIAIASLNLDIILSTILIYKLFYLRQDALLWTNIEFGYSILRLVFQMFADATLGTGTLVSNGIEVIVLIIIWWTFYHHLQRILSEARRLL